MRSRGVSLCLLVLAGCADPEPTFSRRAIHGAAAEGEELFTMPVPGGAVESATPIVGTELEGILSREPIPDPYLPEGRPDVDVTGGGR